MWLTGTAESETQPRRRKTDFVEYCIVEFKEQDLSTQLLHLRKNQLFDLQSDFERYYILLPVYGFYSAKYDNISIQRYLSLTPVKGPDFETTFIKQLSQIVFLQFG